MDNITESLLIGFDNSNGIDNAVLIVGRQPLGHVPQIINAFKGEEAIDIYKKLTTKKEAPESK